MANYNKIMKKVLLLYLPVPSSVPNKNYQEHTGISPYSYPPIASGYLKASLYKEGLLNYYDVDIINRQFAVYVGDALLIDYIVSMKPDIIGLSLFSWNYDRCTYIIKEVKKCIPHVKIIAGGPQVPLFSQYEGLHDFADIAVRGQGHETFPEVLFSLLNKTGLNSVPGISYKTDDNIIFTDFTKRRNSINIPSPYLLGYLDFTEDFYFMFSWGCDYSCLFCCWGAFSDKNMYFEDIDCRIKELMMAREKGVRHIDIVDSYLNVNPAKFKMLEGIIREVNFDNYLKFRGAARADLIDAKTARFFSETNFQNVVIGLETINQNVLKKIGRSFNVNKWLNGVKNLQNLNVSCGIGVISGLPGDSLKGFEKTVNFLVENDLSLRTSCKPLTLFPASYLWDKREEFNLRVQKNAPHLILETPDINFSDIKKSLAIAKSTFNPDFTDMEPYLPYNYPCFSYYMNFLAEYKKYADSVYDFPVNRIIIEDCENLEEFASILSRRISNSVMVWFKGFLGCNIENATKFLNRLSIKNPYNTWHVVIEPNEAFNTDFIGKIENSIFYKPNYLDHLGVYLQDSPEKDYFRLSSKFYSILNINFDYSDKYVGAISEKSILIWRFEGTIDQFYEYFDKIRKTNGCGILLKLNEQNNQLIFQFMKNLRNAELNKKIFFEDSLLQLLWDRNNNNSEGYIFDEHVVLINNGIYSNFISQENLNDALNLYLNE